MLHFYTRCCNTGYGFFNLREQNAISLIKHKNNYTNEDHSKLKGDLKQFGKGGESS